MSASKKTCRPRTVRGRGGPSITWNERNHAPGDCRKRHWCHQKEETRSTEYRRHDRLAEPPRPAHDAQRQILTPEGTEPSHPRAHVTALAVGMVHASASGRVDGHSEEVTQSTRTARRAARKGTWENRSAAPVGSSARLRLRQRCSGEGCGLIRGGGGQRWLRTGPWTRAWDVPQTRPREVPA
jgi:hypothetical protein